MLGRLKVLSNLCVDLRYHGFAERVRNLISHRARQLLSQLCREHVEAVLVVLNALLQGRYQFAARRQLLLRARIHAVKNVADGLLGATLIHLKL